MKIGIYTYHIKVGESGGVQQYSTNLIGALLKYTNHHIYVFTNKELADTDYIGYKIFKNYHEVIFTDRIKRYLKIFFISKIILLTPIPFIINRIHSKFFFKQILAVLGDIRSIIYNFNLDLLHFPTQSLPLYYWNIPVLITLHDLQHKHLPEFFSVEEINSRDYYFRKSAEVCSQIIVSFNHVKEDIIKFYEIDQSKITVTLIGYALEDKYNFDLVSWESISKKYKVPNNFILYPAQTWKHKNHIFLIKVLAKYISKYNQNIFLVCTGIKNKHYNEIYKIIKNLNLEGNILFLGFVENKELDLLYKKTKLLVIPTLYEAGSYPVIEAMSRLVPVIASNVTSIPETIGDRRFLFNPYNEDELCELIYKILNDINFKMENISNSKDQFEKFHWNKIINNFIIAYEKAKENFNIKDKKRIPFLEKIKSYTCKPKWY